MDFFVLSRRAVRASPGQEQYSCPQEDSAWPGLAGANLLLRFPASARDTGASHKKQSRVPVGMRVRYRPRRLSCLSHKKAVPSPRRMRRLQRDMGRRPIKIKDVSNKQSMGPVSDNHETEPSVT